ncbi:MAG: GNAT family N-acetyltransferase [Phycisphaerae bacterium]
MTHAGGVGAACEARWYSGTRHATGRRAPRRDRDTINTAASLIGTATTAGYKTAAYAAATPYAGAGPLRLRLAAPGDRAVIAGWVTSERELLWLAPSASLPLTTQVVAGWAKPGGEALVAVRDNRGDPIAYAELNPMRGERAHYWLGHVVVTPAYRGRGVGRAFVTALLDRAARRVAARFVSLVVFPANTAAIRCYVRAGFRMLGEEYHRFARGGPKHRLMRLRATLPERRG